MENTILHRFKLGWRVVKPSTTFCLTFKIEDNIVSKSLGDYSISPFYSGVLGCQSFEEKWGLEWPRDDANVAAFQM